MEQGNAQGIAEVLTPQQASAAAAADSASALQGRAEPALQVTPYAGRRGLRLQACAPEACRIWTAKDSGVVA